MGNAPILLFTYNRPEHTRRTVEALQKNELADESDLFIYSDGAKGDEDKMNVQKVREYLQTIDHFRSVTTTIREYNYGLANNIIDGVTNLVGKFKKVIVLEDDLITSPFFLRFMNEALDKYKYEENVISIHGYCLPIEYDEPVFFLKGADCWGWATWDRGWELFNTDSSQLLQQLKKSKAVIKEFDFNGTYDYSGMLKKQVKGKVNSWAIRWYASAFLRNKLTLYPGRSLVKNIGGDGSGTHSQDEKQYQTGLNDRLVELKDIPIAESVRARQLIEKHIARHMSIRRRLKKVFK